MDTKQPEARQLANMLRGIDARSRFANEKLSSASDELERLQSENERLRTYNKDARHEIANLQERVQQLGQLARGVNSRRVTELEAQLGRWGGWR